MQVVLDEVDAWHLDQASAPTAAGGTGSARAAGAAIAAAASPAAAAAPAADERGDWASDEEAAGAAPASASFTRRRSRRHEVGEYGEQRSWPIKLLLSMIRAAQCVRRSCVTTCGDSEPGDGEDSAMLYSCIVHARATAGWKMLFGLSSKPRAVCLDFRRPDERDRFISFVEALLVRAAPTGAQPLLADHLTLFGSSARAGTALLSAALPPCSRHAAPLCALSPHL